MGTEEGQDGLVKVAISHLIKFAADFAGVEIHVQVGAKYVKLNYQEDTFIEILRKLQQKDVLDVYVKREDCERIVEHVQQSLSPKQFYDPKTTNEERVESSSAALDVVKSVIHKIGATPETVAAVKTINSRAMSVVGESPSLFLFVKQFRKNCSEQYLLSVLTNYIMSLVIDTFPWKSDQVKEKGALASFLCDLGLSAEDFSAITAWEKGSAALPDKIKQHPLEVAEILKKNRGIIPSETITIIEQHHERPDGSGFPHGIRSGRFNQLSSIFIVCQQFAHKLHAANYDYEKRFDILVELKDKYGLCKTFEKSLDALMKVID